MSISAISIDFTCANCGRQLIAATLRDIWYAAGLPCCSKECMRAELDKMTNAYVGPEIPNEAQEANARAA